ncbi:MAG: hypothetical protein M1818_006974 [Claussenomyces sp. TS43310]|nr:MAG: hypothetical protein M1818_006974 [Claussenomyces sp. TS43310]
MENVPAEPKRARQSKPKVKTGCRTCKYRRVKCDENRPDCLRCRRFGVECEGYEIHTKAPAKFVNIMPRNPLHAIIDHNPGDETEHRYSQFFQEYTASELSGFFVSDFWTRRVLQESRQDNSIRYAIVAIGALYKAVEVARRTELRSEDTSHQIMHFQLALQKYHKAIRCQRDALAKRSVPITTTLISCLLFVCFESFQGNHQSALAQIKGGLNLLKEVHTNWVDRVLPGSHASHGPTVDVELLQMFVRLEVQSKTLRCTTPWFMMQRPLQLDTSTALEKFLLDDPTTRSYSTLDDARRSWDLMMKVLLEFNHAAAYWKYLPPEDVPAVLHEEHAQRLAGLNAWSSKSETFFAQTLSNPTLKEYSGAVILRLHSLVIEILLPTSLDPSEVVYDSFWEQFREIVALTRSLLESRKMPRSTFFMFDMGLVVPLYLTALKCRDRVIRREAISLLRSECRREGIWESGLGAEVGSWIMQLEEQNVSSMVTIPEKHRFRIIDMTFDLQRREATAWCGQRPAAVCKDINVQKTNIQWSYQ